MSRVFAHYKALNKGKSVVKAVQEECPKDYAESVIAYVNCTDTAGSEVADHLRRNLDATNPEFVRTVVARSETDLVKIRREYKRKYGNELAYDLEQRSDHTTVTILKVIINKNKPKPKGARSEKENRASTEIEFRGPREARRKNTEMSRQSRAEATLQARKNAKADRITSVSRSSCVQTNERDGGNKSRAEEDGSDGELQSKGNTTGSGSGATRSRCRSRSRSSSLGIEKENNEGDSGETTGGGLDNDKDGDETEDKESDTGDARILHDAMTGLGTDESAIVDVLLRRTNAQRQRIKQRYQEIYQKDLSKDIRSETSGPFQDLLLCLLMPDTELVASWLHHLISGPPSNHAHLIGLVVCLFARAPSDKVKVAYIQEYHTDLEDAIKQRTSGDLQDLLLKGLSTSTTETNEEDRSDQAQSEAHATMLHEKPTAGTLREVFGNASFQQIQATITAHQQLFGEDISVSINKSSDEDTKAVYLGLVTAHEDGWIQFYTEKLHSCLEDLSTGTGYVHLNRILVCRAETDLATIKAEYEREYGTRLEQAVERATSGDYRDALLAFIKFTSATNSTEDPNTANVEEALRPKAPKEESQTSPKGRKSQTLPEREERVLDFEEQSQTMPEENEQVKSEEDKPQAAAEEEETQRNKAEMPKNVKGEEGGVKLEEETETVVRDKEEQEVRQEGTMEDKPEGDAQHFTSDAGQQEN